MDMEHIKPSTMSTFCAILYSPPHLCRLLTGTFDANYCNIQTTVIGYVPKAQENLIGMNWMDTEITQ